MLVNALRRFRESLRRVTDGAEAFLILTLFILCLDKVSTDHAKLVPLGKVCTAKETLEKNTAKALISLTDDLSLLSNMAALESCPKHNMIAYLEKTEGNVEFHEVIDFLRRSYIYHALTVSPVVSTTFVEQFWTLLRSKTINNVRPHNCQCRWQVLCLFGGIQSELDLIFDDADGIDYYQINLSLMLLNFMGYEGISTVFTLIMLCRILANITVPLDHFPVNSLTSKVFSFMIKKGKRFSGKVTPLFDTMLVQPTQDEGVSSERLSAEQSSPSPAPTSEVPNESLPDSTSTQPSEEPYEQQPDPSPRPSPQPSPTPIVPDSIPEPTGENLRDHSSNDTSLLGNEDDMTLPNVYDLSKIQRRAPQKNIRLHKESVSKQGRKIAKGESSVQRDPLFDVMPEDKIDHMETENAQSEGRTREMVDEDKEIDEVRLSTEDVVSTDKEGVSTDFEKVSTDFEKVSTDFEKVSTDKPIVSTDGSKVSTDEQIEGTDEQVEGTEEHNEGTEEIFEGTEEQREGTEEKVESTAGPKKRTKGKKKIEEEDESESEDDDIPQAVKKFKQLESDEVMARKIQEEWEAEEERNRIAEEKATNEALIKNFDDIKARIEADRILAEKLQEQEREQFTIEERAKFLHDTIAAQRKFLAQQRSEAIRNRPPTKNQLRNQMMTYLKHVGNFKHSELKSKKFEDIQAMYEKIKRSDEDFIAIGSVEDDRLIKRMKKKDSSKGEEIKQESKEEVKEEDKGEENTRKRKHECMVKEILQYIDESASVFDREDLDVVYKLVMDIYQDKIPEGFDKVLWGDLIVMFNPDEQDEFWNSQHEWKVKKYPLKKEILVQMLKLIGVLNEKVLMALELIRISRRVINSPCFLVKSWLVQDQTVLALASPNTNDEELSIPEQTATGKGTSNPLMAGSLPKTTKPT
ncbi:hypothetical protein Tco_1392597 [Tanacetum coccineum]